MSTRHPSHSPSIRVRDTIRWEQNTLALWGTIRPWQEAVHSPVDNLRWWWSSHQAPPYLSWKKLEGFTDRKERVNGLWHVKDQQTLCFYCWIQRTEDVNVLLMAFQLHGGLLSPCDVVETSDGSKDSVIYCHVHSKHFNSWIKLTVLTTSKGPSLVPRPPPQLSSLVVRKTQRRAGENYHVMYATGVIT